MNTNHINPELEPLVPLPMRQRYVVVGNAVREAIMADQARYPDIATTPERPIVTSTQNNIPLYSEAVPAAPFIEAIKPVVAEAEAAVTAVSQEISDAQRAVAEALGAQDDLQKAA